MNLAPLLVVGAVAAVFLLLWYFLGTVAGMLWTPRALAIKRGMGSAGDPPHAH